MIFVDSGAWFAAFVPADVHHPWASAWLDGNTHPLMTTDYVVDETLTLLKSRGEHRRALDVARLLFGGHIATIHFLTESDIRAAFDVFTRYHDKDWSFTDCTSKVVMERLGLATAFAFDHHFHQFGSVAVFP